MGVLVASFIGSPAMNLFDADVVDGGLKFGTAVAKGFDHGRRAP